MSIRTIRSSPEGVVAAKASPTGGDGTDAWRWIDIHTDSVAREQIDAVTESLGFDALAVRDAVDDFDFPKVDDFGSHLLVVLHGLRDDRIDTYEVDCFVSDGVLVTIHTGASPALDALWEGVQIQPGLGGSSADVLLGRLADVLTRRLYAVLDVFDERYDELTEMALSADPRLLGELTAVRADLRSVRRIVHPQRDTVDLLRRSVSPLITDSGRRLFSDVFDVADRAARGLDGARNMLAETLDAYRGAEARQATDVTKVLTVYAAIMLPLTLVTGFFGMNFPNLPWLRSSWGWAAASLVMLVIAVLSVGVFVSVGWIRRPSGRAAGVVLGHGLIEAAKAPIHIGGAVYGISTMPLRRAASRGQDDDEGSGGA